MINFDKHFNELLNEEDFLIIPGIGALIAVFTPASLSESGDLIPPSKTFKFSGLLTTDDSHKLLNYLLKKDSQAKEEVEKQLKDHLYQFKSQINTNNAVFFSNVLAVKKTKEGLLEGKFISKEDFYTKAVPKNVFNPDVSNAVSDKTLEQNKEDVYNEPVLNVDNLYTAEIEEDYEEQENKPWMRYMLYLLPLFLIFGALYYVMFYKPFQKEVMVTDSAEIVSNEALIIETDSLGSDTTNVNTEFTDQNAVVQKIEKDIKKEKYQVSAGLFKNKTNAENLVARMKASGFEAEITVVSGMRRVIVVVNSIDEAEVMSNKIEQFTGDKSVYFNEHGVSNK
ncbi:MAG: hypothetical protein ACI8UX_001159 [Psychromonas sp.]|jgi:hypothetical protein